MDDNEFDDISGYADVIPYFEHQDQEQVVVRDGGQGAVAREEVLEAGAPPVIVRARRSRGWLYGLIALPLAVVIVLVGVLFWPGKLLTGSKTVGPSPVAVIHPGFRTAACPFKPAAGMVEGQGVKCGYLTVPEQRDNPQSGGIKLAVAIFKNPDATLSASGMPTIFLDGGPGGSALRDLGKLFISSDVQLLAPGGDLVLLDQRGVGYSQPALDCPEMGQAEQSNFNRDFVREFLLKAVQRCHDRLSASGVQLSAYNTIENAGDVHDLIHMLGYQRANLYGSSYGTLLALTVMRLYPGDLRGVVLDSVVPAQHNLYRDEPVVTQHAFNTLFKGCEASTICNNAYPQLGTVFDKLVYKWNAHKVRFQDNQGNALLMSGDDLIGVLYEALYDTEAIPLLPEVIWRASDGDYTALARLLGRLDGTSDTELGADPITRGMYYSVVCGEDMAFTSLEELKTAIQPVRFSLQSFLRDDVEYIAAVCNIWKEKPVPAAQNQPVVSSVPTLVLSGEYDPITPPSYGREAVQTLDHSFFFQFPGMGHGVVGARSCPAQIARDFLRDPSRRPGTGCIGDMSEPGFV